MNAKKEFLKSFDINYDGILCAEIIYEDPWNDDNKVINLPVDYTEEEMSKFIEALDFDYDSGYGTQELFGTIWFEDGSWASRKEYDGSEWWAWNVLPEIPNHLKK